MRGFIVLCLSAVALAAPQGYNYNPGPSSSHQVSSVSGFGGLSSHASSGGHSVQPNFGIQSHQTHHHTQQHQQQHQQQQHQTVISKRFYIHTAPEEEADSAQEKHITVGVPRKNYNVVFIKAPSKANRNHAIKISPAVNEEKTVIYVLSKKTDASDIQAEVIESIAPTAKPEVFFIKYKTNEEAHHAQEQIQAQYDALGGSSQVIDEGVAPVSSVIGSLGGGGGAHGAGSTGSSSSTSSSFTGSSGIGGGFTSVGGSGGYTSGNSNNAYLPPNLY